MSEMPADTVVSEDAVDTADNLNYCNLLLTALYQNQSISPNSPCSKLNCGFPITKSNYC